MIRHVALECRREDAEAEAAFWELLGFRRVAPPAPLRERALWVERGGTQVHLLHVEQPVAASRGHVAVEAPDHDAALARLRAAGHRVEPRRAHWGSPRAYVRTPAGHLVEVMAFPPA